MPDSQTQPLDYRSPSPPVRPRKLALIARGALFATAFWTGLYSLYVYQNEPSGGVSGPMYWWIRHFYGSVSICVLSLFCSIFTFSSNTDAG